MRAFQTWIQFSKFSRQREMLLTNGQEEVNNLKSQLKIQEEELAQVSDRLLE